MTDTTELRETRANLQRIAQVRQTLERLYAEGLHRGFYGALAVELRVQDGTIQEIQSRIENVQR